MLIIHALDDILDLLPNIKGLFRNDTDVVWRPNIHDALSEIPLTKSDNNFSFLAYASILSPNGELYFISVAVQLIVVTLDYVA